MNEQIPKVVAGPDGMFHCPVPNCPKPDWPSEWAFRVHYSRKHVVRERGSAAEKKKARDRAYYHKRKHKQAQPEPQPELDYSCPVCGTPQAPIVRGLKEALRQRMSCHKELTQ